MEYRKLVKLGTNSLVITLPPPWIRKYSLQKGDNIYVETIGDYLIVHASQEKVEEQKVVNINVEKDTPVEILRRRLTNAYYDNSTTIIFEGPGLTKNAQLISQLTELFTALEVVEHTRTKITCKTYINTQEVDVQSFMKRIDNGIRSLFSDLASIQEKTDKEITISFLQRHKSMSKLIHLLKRVIKDRLYKQRIEKETPLTLLSYWDVITILERIGLHIVKASKEKHKPQDIVTLLHEYEQNMKSFYKKEFRHANIKELHQSLRILRQAIKNIGHISY